MKKDILEKSVVTLPKSFKKILEQIDKHGLGIVFVVNESNQLIGSITDGDIRRSLLKNSKLLEGNISIDSDAVNKKPFSLPYKSDIQEILNNLSDTIKSIPLLDSNNRIVDISTRSRVRQFPISQPEIGNQELTNVTECIKTGWISSRGSYIAKFEKLFKDYLNGGYPVAVSNGTTALQLGMSTLGIKKNDEVLLPNFTFAASINSIINCGAKPVLVDVDEKTWTIDLNQIKKSITKFTKAIMPVHVYGQPCKMDEILKIAKENNLLVIEDCAEAIGAKYKDRTVGNDGDCSCFSFFANKTVTTGEGGMVVFKEEAAAKRARILRDHGMSPTKNFWHEYAGFNFRMTNMQAAIGVSQMERINDFLQSRKKIFDKYNSEFKKVSNIDLMPSNNWSKNSYWLYTLTIKDFGEKRRDILLNKLIDRGIECRPAFYPINIMKPYKKFANGKYNVSKYISENSISLPSSSTLNEAEQKHIINAFLEELNNIIKN